MDVPQAEAVIGPREREAVVEYMEKDRWLTEFEETEQFEQAIASATGSEHALVVSNGTISLVVALMALGIGPGDEVIVPDLTFIASAYAVSLTGAEPVLVDVDRETLCLDPEKADEAVSEDTEAVVYVSLNGRSHAMDGIEAFCDRHDLRLVEDAAQSLGSTWNSRQLGTFGDVGSFSFSYSKIVTTGQGGALVTDDRELYDRMARIKDFGRPESGVDRHVQLGLNAKFTDLQAVVGIEQVDKLDERVQRKQALYERYHRRLRHLDELSFVPTDTDRTAPYGIDVMVDGDDREDLREFLASEGVDTRPFYPPVHTQEPYARDTDAFPVSTSASRRGLWLPSSVALTDEEVEGICDLIETFFADR